MANVSGTISITENIQQTKSSGFPGSSAVSITGAFTRSGYSFTNGTGAGQADTRVFESVSLAAAPLTIDLTSLIDVFGAAASFGHMKYFRAANLGPVTQDITLGLGASNGESNFLGGTSPTVPIKGTGEHLWADTTVGVVVDGTHKTLKFDPGANTITMELHIVGTST